MAVKGSFPIRVESNLQGFAVVLRIAVCEWFLLFFLLLDAAFSYFLTKFAQYCELELPCIFCSRLDHIWGKEKPDFYNNLLCKDHRSEISSWVSCDNHGKLADIHGMCEECLLSFAKKETNEEAYKLLVGKLGPDCLQKPFSSIGSGPGSFTTRFCSCCSRPWRSRPQVQKLVHSKPPASASSEPDIPLPKSPGHRCLNRQDGLKKRKDRFSVSTTPLVQGTPDFDTLSHVGYTEVKINSDSDSDFLFSDEDDFITAPRDHKTSKDDYIFQQGSKLLPKKQFLRPNLQLETGETTTPKFPFSDGRLESNFSEINWPQLWKKTSPLLPELNLLDDIPLTSSSSEFSAARTKDEVDRVPMPEKLSGPSLPNLINNIGSLQTNINQRTISPSVNMHVPMEQSKENCLDNNEKNEIGLASAKNGWQSIDLDSIRTAVNKETDSTRNESSITISSCSTNDPRAPVSSTSKEVNTSDSSSELERGTNDKGSTDKVSTSKASAPHMVSSYDKSEAANGHADRPHMSQAADSVESQTLSRLPSSYRSGSSKLPEANVGEIEGEKLVDKLRQEIENDKKRINDLYKELEEERNAAAIAANQAMAMITKLQEEKAALHMEALQYLRMMEEQAEYDVDALEKANDLIAEKEKEIQDLQAELDYYRIKYGDEFEAEMMGLNMADGVGSYMETSELEKP